jgi:hypothetical protein
MGPTTTAARYELEEDPRLARLREELDQRDEIIVALQHVIRDLRHELENVRAEHVYAVFAHRAPPSQRAGLWPQLPAE